MRNLLIGIFSLFVKLAALPVAAQADTPAMVRDLLRDEKGVFLDYINYIPMDSNILFRLTGFMEREADSIEQQILGNQKLAEEEKVKALKSLVYFIRELGQDLSLQKFEAYETPAALESYKKLLRSLLDHTSYETMLAPLSPRHSQLLADAFWQYSECDLLEDIAVFKRVASSPRFILPFLEINPRFRFSDSLLLVVAAHDPFALASYLRSGNNGLRETIRGKKNIYLQQIARLADHREASELLPFVVPLAEKRITPEEIQQKRMDVTLYFQLLVNTLVREGSLPQQPVFSGQAALRNAIREKAISFYVNRVNELHAAAEETRFAVVRNLRIEDIYYILTSCEEELYTSSYLGLYRRLMDKFSYPTADSVFRLVHHDNFRVFMRLAANYNTLADFLGCMPAGATESIIAKFMTGIEEQTEAGLEKAMDIADAFNGLAAVPGLGILVKQELQNNLSRCRSGNLYLGIRLYSILQQVYTLVEQKEPAPQLWTSLGNQDVLERRALQNEKGEIVEMVLFYGDEDGISSFSSFMKLFKDSLQWRVDENERWVTIRSRKGQSLVIYANLPLENKDYLDLEAQDSLSRYLQKQSQVPVILVHRGHSYHLYHTFRRLHLSVKLAILGSCGGNNNIISVARISPRAQIIISKKTGSKYINDPLLDVINETLKENGDLVWTRVWEKLAIRFRKDPVALSLFNDYIPPTKNVSLFVLKLFNN